MTNDQLWERVRGLEGKALETAQHHVFKVLEVSATHVTVAPQRTGRARRVPRLEIEAGFALGSHKWRPIRIREAGASEYNPAYVAAILIALTAE